MTLSDDFLKADKEGECTVRAKAIAAFFDSEKECDKFPMIPLSCILLDGWQAKPCMHAF